jgi:hypothetical protein
MASTVLSLVQDFCGEQGLPVPPLLVGSQETSIRQFLAISQMVMRELSEFRWADQRLRKTWTSITGQDQGPLTTIFGSGYYGIEPGTLWNQSRRMRIFGPLSDQIWQALQVLPNAGPEFQSWISAGRLYVSPAQNGTDTLSGIYITKYTVLGVDLIAKERITADSDTLLFPDMVFLLGLKYRWRKAKGESGWEDDFNAFIGSVAKNIIKDGAPTLALSANNKGPRPGIVIPSGSWNV